MSVRRYNAIFLSPHLDDAVLSAGNQLQLYTEQGKAVLVVTIFTKGSESRHPAAVSFLRQSGYSHANQLFAHRKKEDIAALRLLGADHLHLPYIDAGFRTEHPTTEHIFKSSFTQSDRQLVTSIHLRLSKIMTQYAADDCHVFGPLAVGNHIDHEIVYEAARKTWDPSQHWQLSFWEDVPYRHRTGETCTRLAQVSTTIQGMRRETVFTRSSKLKQAAIFCYSSQFSGLINRGGYCQTYDNQIESYWHA